MAIGTYVPCAMWSPPRFTRHATRLYAFYTDRGTGQIPEEGSTFRTRVSSHPPNGTVFGCRNHDFIPKGNHLFCFACFRFRSKISKVSVSSTAHFASDGRGMRREIEAFCRPSTSMIQPEVRSLPDAAYRRHPASIATRTPTCRRTRRSPPPSAARNPSPGQT